MIYHYKDNLQKLSYTLKTPLKYSDEYTFYPLKIKTNDFIVQTPRLFVPYGLQVNQHTQKQTNYVMISFQNKLNDSHTEKFLSDLQYIYELVKHNYDKTHQVNPFIKSYKDESIMNLKLKDNSIIYDSHQNKIDDIPVYGYCSFILHLVGLWISTDSTDPSNQRNQVWFQWYILQTKTENNIHLTDYAFKENIPLPPPPPPLPPPIPSNSTMKDKYKKMISMGIPSAAIQQTLQIERKGSINSDMLSSVKLKKAKPKKDILKTDMNGFEPPSLDSLQQALRNLRNSIQGK